MIDKNFRVKLCDFGWSASFVKERQTFCGTYEYMAPEIFENSKYGKAIDIWSLGILLYELLHGHSPFKGKSLFDVYKNIIKNRIKFKEDIHPLAKDLILRILRRDPK